jgi:hypothetical protein
LIFAAEQHAVAAVFAVLEFRGDSCSAANLARNESDLQSFLALLGGAASRAGQLLGPFAVHGGGKIQVGIPLFVGKAVREVSARAV